MQIPEMCGETCSDLQFAVNGEFIELFRLIYSSRQVVVYHHDSDNILIALGYDSTLISGH